MAEDIRQDFDVEGGRGRRGGRKKAPGLSLPPDHKFDYKDPQQLRHFITDRGKIVPRRISGLTAKQTAMVSTGGRISLRPDVFQSSRRCGPNSAHSRGPNKDFPCSVFHISEVGNSGLRNGNPERSSQAEEIGASGSRLSTG